MSFAPSKLTRVTSTNAATVSSAASLDQTSMEVVSVKCPKEQKDYYMVIKNVKKAHQIQDSGEFQEFNDDVDYILGGLGAKNSLSTRWVDHSCSPDRSHHFPHFVSLQVSLHCDPGVQVHGGEL